MKNLRFFEFTLSVEVLMSSFVLLSNVFKRKTFFCRYGKKKGVEKLASGDPKAEKAARKAKKFKS